MIELQKCLAMTILWGRVSAHGGELSSNRNENFFAPGLKGVRVGKGQWRFSFSRPGFCPQMKNGHLLILK